MPREIVHWTVLTKAESKLQQQGSAPLISECLTLERPAAFLGSLAHDAPYYYKFGGDPFQEAAEYLHGSPGNDTFLPIKIACSEIQKEQNPEQRMLLMSFLLGMVSHAVTDWNFHPFVFYFTGNYNHPDPQERVEARRRHRLLETYLDSWFRRDHSFWNKYLLLSSVRDLGSRLDSVYRLLDTVMVPESFQYHGVGKKVDEELLEKLRVRSIEGRWSSSMSYLVYLQVAFLSPLLGRAAKGIRYLYPAAAQNEVLFSCGRLEALERFSMPFQYLNPVSGESTTEKIEVIAEQASVECAELFERFEPILAGSTESVFSLLSGIEGKSLNFGLSNAAVSKAKHYSASGLDLPGLSID